VSLVRYHINSHLIQPRSPLIAEGHHCVVTPDSSTPLIGSEEAHTSGLKLEAVFGSPKSEVTLVNYYK
jgi:hypothetical protein